MRAEPADVRQHLRRRALRCEPRNRKLVRAVLHLCKLAAGEAQHHDEPRRNFRAPLAARKSKAIITPKQITTPKNELVFDLGQNITGWFTFMADLPAGVELRVQTGELLQDDCFYRDNLRTALSEYRYISTGKKAFIRPIATFYGFRYIKFSGVATSPASRIFRRGRFIPTSSRPARSRPQTRRSTACT